MNDELHVTTWASSTPSRARAFATAVRALVAIAAACGLGCEHVTSRHPLATLENAKPDVRVLGLWLYREDPKSRDRILIDITPADGAMLDIAILGRETDGARLARCNGFPSIVGGRTYLNVRCKGLFENEEGREPYDIVRYEVVPGHTLELWYMNAVPVKDAITAGTLAGELHCAPEGTDGSGLHLEPSCDPTLTSATAELARFVARTSPQKLFPVRVTLRAVPVPKTSETRRPGRRVEQLRDEASEALP